MKLEEIEKTAFSLRYGQLEYLVMPTRAYKAPVTFQNLMNQIFHDCIDNFVKLYIDHLLIFSKKFESHYNHFEVVLQRLCENELYASPNKCVFLKEEIDLLSMLIGKNGIEMNPEKVRGFQNWPKPRSVTEVLCFVGLLQFIPWFISKFAKTATTWTDHAKRWSRVHNWNDSCDKAFECLKSALIYAPILVCPDWGKPFR